MELLDTKTGLEGQGSKVNSEQHGKRGKVELVHTKTGLEGQGSKVNSEQHGKRGKRGKMELLDVKIGLEIRARKSTTWKGWKSWIWSTRKPLLPSFPCRWFWTPLHEPGFGVQELQFSTLSMLFRLHFRTLPFESDFEVQELQFTFEPCPSSPILKSRSFSFPRFPCWLFEPSQHPPGNHGNRGNGGSDLLEIEAGQAPGPRPQEAPGTRRARENLNLKSQASDWPAGATGHSSFTGWGEAAQGPPVRAHTLTTNP